MRGHGAKDKKIDRRMVRSSARLLQLIHLLGSRRDGDRQVPALARDQRDQGHRGSIRSLL